MLIHSCALKKVKNAQIQTKAVIYALPDNGLRIKETAYSIYLNAFIP